MKIRRLFVLLSALALTGSATGCGKKGEPQKVETKAPETAAPETKAPETKAPETKATETKAPENNLGAADAGTTEATKAPETNAPDAGGGTTAEPPTNPPAAPPSPVVKLLEPGADPKIDLSMKPAAGLAQSALLTMTIDADMNVGGQQVPMKFPPFKMGVSLKVDEVRANGDIAFSIKVDSADVGETADVIPAVMEAMKGAIGKVVGMGGKSVVDAHGVTKEAKFEVPPDAPNEVKQVVDSFQQSIGQMAIPFPAEPVGVGAKWQSTVALEQMQLKVDQTSTYEIVSIEGSVVKVKFSVQLNAPPQAMKSAQMKAGLEATLNKFQGSGVNEATFDLTKVLPVSSSGKNAITMDMSLKDGTQAQNVLMKMNVDMKLEPK